MSAKNFKMGLFTSIYQCFLVVLIFILLFWDCEFSDFVKSHLGLLAAFLFLFAIMTTVLDYFLRIRADEKKKQAEKSNVEQQSK